LAFGNIYINAVVNIPSGHALHLTTQEMVQSRLVHGKISIDNKYSMNISNSVLAGYPAFSVSGIQLDTGYQ
jgi:hypothetical protein